MILTLTSPCVVVRDRDGNPWRASYDLHFDTVAEAEQAIKELRQHYDTPDGEEASLVAVDTHPTYLQVIADRRTLLDTLTPITLPHLCTLISCDGCGIDPSPQDGPTHFPPDGWDPDGWDWTSDGAHHHCPTCLPLTPQDPA